MQNCIQRVLQSNHLLKKCILQSNPLLHLINKSEYRGKLFLKCLIYICICVCVCRCDFVLDVIFSMLQNLFQILAPFSHFLGLLPHIYVCIKKRLHEIQIVKISTIYYNLCLLSHSIKTRKPTT